MGFPARVQEGYRLFKDADRGTSGTFPGTRALLTKKKIANLVGSPRLGLRLGP